MSLSQLKDQAAQLLPVEQRQLIAFLVAEQAKKEEGFKEAMARKIDDNDPTHWIDLDEARERLAE